MPALMKAKEKANRTKCANNLRIIGGEDCDDGNFDGTDLIAVCMLMRACG